MNRLASYKAVLILLIVEFICTGWLFSQDQPPRLQVRKISEPIRLNGILDETAWEAAELSISFTQFFPTDSVPARRATSFRMLYDETTLYVGIRAETSGEDAVVTSLRRDFGGATNDNVTLMIDTFSDGTNAFLFGVTPYGVQREALVQDGGSTLNTSWDMKWQAEAIDHGDYFTIEMAIPFTSVKFPEGSQSWRLQCYRWNIGENEQSAWARVPQNQLLSNLAFAGEIVFEEPLGKSRTPLALIPYVNTRLARDYEADESTSKLSVGGDAKVAIGNGMNLDITVNPDFSNVEVDDIFTNLTRFEIRLPEKRQFFIDNSDLFQNFGNFFNEAKPFFSRRIGLARDTTGNLIENRIIGGVRLSGKLDQNWRLGVLNLQTDSDAPNEIPSYNNSMFALQRKVFARSNIGVFWVNRQTFGEYDYLEPEERYNRVIGMDYNLASADNRWTGKFYLHKSYQPGDSEGNLSSQATVTYNTRKYEFTTDWVYIDEDFRADLGFVPRTDIFKVGNRFVWKFYPEKGPLNNHNLSFLSILYWRPGLDFKKTDHLYELTWEASFRDQGALEVNARNNYIFLVEPFDPTRTPGGVPLPGDTGYTFNQVSATYSSNPAKRFTWRGGTTLGEFFNGQSYSVSGTLGLRFQPWVQLSLGVNYDGIQLPNPHPDADLWLVTPRVEVTFSRSLFWSTLIQYSNQRDNLGINSRLQWRFAPMSDLFLVYNDNYFTTRFTPRFRSINLKLTYWLNI